MKATEARPWLKYYRAEDLEMVMPEMSVTDYLLSRNSDCMDRPALNYFDRIISFREVFDRIYETANAYASIGVKKGDIVLVCAPTTPETIYTFYGLSLLGAVSNMIDPRQNIDGIRGFINEVDSRFVMTVDVAYEKMTEAIKGTKVEKVVVMSPAESLPFPKKQLYRLKNPPKKDLPADFISWGSFIEAGKSYKTEYIHSDSRDCCIIVHTGGTTGRSKSVMLSHSNLNAVSFEYCKCPMRHIRKDGKDKFLDIMPPFVAYGMGYGVHIPLANHLICVIVPKFEPENFAKLVLHHKPQDIAGAPSHFLTLMNDRRMKNADLSFFTNASCGGDNLSLKNEQKLSKWLLDHHAPYPITKGYGMTELAAVSTACMLNINRPGSVGVPHADYLIAAFNRENGEELDMGQTGEICVTGPTVMMGYYNNPEETDKVKKLHADGRYWIHTGDFGYMDEEGFLYIKGRIKRMIIRTDGFKVFPFAIEEVISECEDVAQVSVVGTATPGQIQGQVPHVYYTVKRGCARSEQEIEDELRKRCLKALSEYSQPEFYTRLDTMPFTKLGKIDYRLLESM